jgi:hypothetical protein
MPDRPTGPPVPITICDRTGRHYVVRIAHGPVTTALKLIALHGPAGVTLRLEGFRADGRGAGRAGLTVQVERGRERRDNAPVDLPAPVPRAPVRAAETEDERKRMADVLLTLDLETD